MTENTSSQQDTSEDDLPIIHVDIRLTRRIGVLPPMAMAMWQGMKAFLAIASLLGMFVVVLRPELEVGEALRYAMCLIVLWQFWEHLIAKNHYGTSHILVTTKGVCLTAENIYVRWDDIENWKNDGKLLRMRPKSGHGPKGFMAAKECDIPLTESNREFLLEIFREKVPRWRPDAK